MSLQQREWKFTTERLYIIKKLTVVFDYRTRMTLIRRVLTGFIFSQKNLGILHRSSKVVDTFLSKKMLIISVGRVRR